MKKNYLPTAKRVLFLFCILLLVGNKTVKGQAAITFQGVNQISDASVSTFGTLDYAYILDGSGTASVNGVSFVESGSSSDFTLTGMNAAYNGYDGNGDTSDLFPVLTNAAYYQSQNSSDIAPGGYLEFNNLVSGNSYEFEIFVNDSRPAGYGDGRYETFSSVSNGSSDTSGDVYFNNTNFTNGDDVVGAFISDGTSETVYYFPGLNTTLSPGGMADDQINGFEVRDITDVPEPSTWAMLLGGCSLLGVFARRRLA